MFEKHHQLADAISRSQSIRDSFKPKNFIKEIALTTLYVVLFIATGVFVGLWGIPTLAAFAGTALVANILNQLFYKLPVYLLAQRRIQQLA